MIQNLAEHPNYLYNCTIPWNSHYGTGKNINNLVIMVFCFVSVFLCISVIATIFTNKKLMNIHPSKLIASMAISLINCTWHIGIWKMNTISFICYTEIAKSYMNSHNFLFGTISEEEAIKDLVYANNRWFNFW